MKKSSWIPCLQILAGGNYKVSTATDGMQGLALIQESQPDLVFVDLKMPGISGLEVLEKVKELDATIVSVVITGFATVSSAVEAMKRGAYDFLPVLESGPGTPEDPVSDSIPSSLATASEPEADWANAFVPATAAPASATAEVTPPAAAGSAPDTAPPPGAKPVPTRIRHQQLLRTHRRRASDQPILGIPRQQYQAIVEESDKRLRGLSDDAPSAAWEAALRQWCIDPARWCESLEHFRQLFHRAVGHVEKLAQVVARTGRQWIQGTRPCRDLFQ